MIYSGILLVVYIVEMLTAYIFFSQAGTKKYKPIFCYLIGTTLFVTALLINVLGGNIIWINLIYFALVNIAFGYFCFDIKVQKIIVYSIILVTISIIWEYTTEFILGVFIKIPITSYLDSNIILILMATISKGLYFISVFILSRFIVKDKSVKIPFSLYIYPFTIFIGTTVTWYVCVYCGINAIGQLALAVMCLILLLPTIITFITYQRNTEKENELFLLKNEMNKIEIEKNYYDILEQQNQDLMIYAHDAKKHLTAIKNLNDNPQIEEYINIMTENLDTYSQASQSGNRTLDVILNKYITECRMKNIKLSLDIRLKNLNYVKDYDLVTILSNLLDNALESAEKSERREISLSTDYRNTYDILIVSNSCDKAPKSLNNTLLTTKNDKKIHGIGIKSVTKTLKKYNGDYDWRYDSQNKSFTSIIMLSNTK